MNLGYLNSKQLYKHLKKEDIYKNIYKPLSRKNLPPGHWYGIEEEEQSKGIIGFIFKDNICYFHGGVYKAYRGTGTRLLTEILSAMRTHHHLKFGTIVHKDNILGINIAKKCGFKIKEQINDILVFEENIEEHNNG